jgi:hypothetical protein
MWQRAVRVGVYVLLGFVVGSVILGTVKGNAFLGNVVYGLWTGAIAGAVIAIIYFAVLAARSRQ